ncbi:hypothetical protein HYH02_006343 [Chlamydomonas schloesseri]|uniref:Leucine-rich repeat-containing protein 56 n=1 Tax=Chlamydomonas schloesseri TaxID=2026947 RepID=A0A835WJA0_9CHLO|nr:hypothetical protein HYH02_006343 [Chlamydomonas schloesseri]|eukprot:KAG2448451.1 hypothetical protein HYH02_006343 [Chlamydomonas schloesseri]
MEFDRENPSPLARLPGQEQAWNDLSVPEVERAYLEQLAGVERLEDATSLQLVVNTATGGSIAHLGASLPNLHELNLNGSTLDSLRDLGTGFRLLQVLWVSRCGLRSLDGLNGLTALRELYAAYNDISDLQPVDCCPQLEVLDVECNCVQHVEDAAHYLAACPHLQTLSMAGNPAADQPRYRQALCAALPALTMLDDEPVTPLTGPSSAAGAAAQRAQDGAASGSPQKLPGAAIPAPPLKAAAALLSQKPSPVAAVALGFPEEAAESSAGAAPLGPPDAEEVALVVAGIKHARVGVDSHEFREIEMNLLVAAADGTDVQLEGRPGTATLLPSSTSTWMRTLRSSREGSLAVLRASHAAAAATGAVAAAAAGSSHSPSASSGASPAGSRPPSARTSAPQERWATPSSTAASAAGVGFSVGSPGPGLPPSGLRRPGSGGGGGGTGPGCGDSPSMRRPGSGDARPGTSTSRPFSARPGTAASFSVRIGTSQSTGAAPGTASSLGLYWAKNRIGGGASGGGGPPGGGDGAAAGGGGGVGVGNADGEGPAGSKLTQGTEAAFGGSLARDLRKWKGAAARAGGAAVGGGGRREGAGGGGASAISITGGNGLSTTLLRGGQLDPKALLEELKRWKLETADRVLFVDPDEVSGAAGDGGWTGADGNGNGRAAASAFPAGSGGGGADILRLSSSQDGAAHDAALLGPEPASSPAVPSSPLQPARPPPGAAAAGRRKMVLAKVCRDIAADSVGSSGASISEILASRPVRTPTGTGAGPSTAWGEQHAPERTSAPVSQHHHHGHGHHHTSSSGVGGSLPRPSSARSGCSSSGQSDYGPGLVGSTGVAGVGNSFAAPAYPSRPGSREEAASSGAGAAGLPTYPSLTRQRSGSSRAPGLPPGPSAPVPGAYRVTSVAGEVDVRLSNPHPTTRLDEG